MRCTQDPALNEYNFRASQGIAHVHSSMADVYVAWGGYD